MSPVAGKLPTVKTALASIEELLSTRIHEQLLLELEELEQTEVHWLCYTDKAGIVQEAEVLALGTSSLSAAFYEQMQRANVLIHKHPGGILHASAADIELAAELRTRGIGSYLINNTLDKIRVLAPALAEQNQEALDIAALQSYLRTDGPLAGKLANYQERPGQLELLNLVASSFNESSITVAEGATGVGKSFAYLIPALKWAATNSERVVIATSTINLQAQLIQKDIPNILQMMDLTELKVVLVKGRNNYLCLARLDKLNPAEQLFEDPWLEQLEMLREWSTSSLDGSLSDLSFQPPAQLWQQVAGESDNCYGISCPFYERCFIFKARRQAASADVLVVNHHLLFADLAIRHAGLGYDGYAVVPAYKNLLIDEAHNIERNALSFFSQKLNKYILTRRLSKIYFNKRGQKKGLVKTLQNILAPQPSALKLGDNIIKIVGVVQKKMLNLEQKTTELIGTQMNLRFTSNEPEPALAASILSSFDDLRLELLRLVNACDDLAELAQEHLHGDDMLLLTEWKAVTGRLCSLGDFCASFTAFNSNEDNIYWIDRRKNLDSVGFDYNISPLDIDSVLQDTIYANMKTLVLTSASLTVDASFNYWFARIGLKNIERQLSMGTYQSTFAYKEQVQLLILSDAPDIRQEEYYQTYMEAAIIKAVLANEGGALILFTSHAALDKTYNNIAERLTSAGIPLLCQGHDENSRLLQQFRNDEKTCLLGTDSFWEGVDVAGSSLSLLIICRLPFRNPYEAIVQAHMERIERLGGSSFFDYSLPEAIIRFRQGFGRLMRSDEDGGSVLVLDKRIITKPYGRLFINSLPKTNVRVAPGAELASAIIDFRFA